MNAPNVWQMLDISTAHIKRATAYALGEDGKFGSLYEDLSYVHWYDSGWIICVPSDDSTCDRPDLEAIFDLARKLDCTYVQLDYNGSEMAALPTYDWEDDDGNS